MRVLPILFAGLVLRLVHINAPILGHNSWRQADTASIARNYTRNGYDFLHPTVQWGGDGVGGAATEFPLFEALHALLGASPIAGRLLAVFFSLAACWAFYRLVSDVIDETTALWSTALFTFLPMSVFYGRTVQPESLMLFGMIGGVWAFRRWVIDDRPLDGVLALAGIAVAVLIKPQALHIGAPLAFLIWHHRGPGGFKDARFWVFAALVFAPAVAWYAWAWGLYGETGLTFFMWQPGLDKWGNLSIFQRPEFWVRILWDRLAWKMLCLGLVPVLALGMSTPRSRSEVRLFDVWLGAAAAYVLIVAAGNYHHDYYQLPFLAPFALFCGRALANHLKPAADPLSLALVGCLCATTLYGGWWYSNHLARENRAESADWAVAQALAELPADEVILSVSLPCDPTVLYLADRRARCDWQFPDGGIDVTEVDVTATLAAYPDTRHVLTNLPGDYPGTVVLQRGDTRIIRLSR